jgi:hypothetical protein
MSLDRSLGVISQRAEVEKKLIGLAKTTDSLLERLGEIVAIDQLDDVGEELVRGLMTRLTAGVREVRAKHRLLAAHKKYDTTEDPAEKEALVLEIAAQDDKNPKALLEFKTISRRTTWPGEPRDERKDYPVGEPTADDFNLLKKTLADFEETARHGQMATIKGLIAECTEHKWPVTMVRIETLLKHRGVSKDELSIIRRTIWAIEEHMKTEERLRFGGPWSRPWAATG